MGIICVCMYLLHICLPTYIHLWINAYTHICMHIILCTYLHTCVFLPIYIPKYVHSLMYIHICHYGVVSQTMSSTVCAQGASLQCISN